MAAKAAIISALDGTTASTGVKIVASPTLAQYDALATAVNWYDPTEACLVVNGTEYAKIKGVMHGANLSATPESIAAELGFRKVIVLGSMTARAVIVPYSSIGFLARVPTLIASYKESGVETDETSGLSVGIVVADDQATNKEVVNADLWFGVAAVSANAAATTPGIIKVGTQA